ncbi:MAG: hypothetical protein PWP23_1558 [Candidatus Sumerlaeota bacterium]|nr:hypothetical protein [Candidatus Sumerlaeota bacterium]
MLRRLAGFVTLFAGMLLPAAEIPVPADYEAPFTPEGKPLAGLVITIDAGHGGYSFSNSYSGSARGVNSRVVEQDLNMRVTALAYHHLRDAGAEVHMTRRDDRKVTLGPTVRAVELGARPALADAMASHLFLSFHHNAAGRETADGVMMLIWPTDSQGNDQPLERAFADIVREEVEKQVHHNEPFSHYVVDHPLVSASDIPSAVVEFGFLTNPEFDEWVVKPTAHHAEALGVYNGIVRMWTEHREELEAKRAELFPDVAAEKKETVEANPAFPLGRPSWNAWPFDSPATTEEEAAFIVSAWKNAMLTDRTTFHLDAKPRLTEDGWVLEGRTNVPLSAAALARELGKALGKEVRNDVRPLPAESLGTDPFGVVAIPMAMTWGEPEEGRNVQTQVLLGEPLFLLDRTEDGTFFLVQGIDGYTAWLRSDAVQQVTRAEFTELLSQPKARVRENAMLDAFRVPPGASLAATATGTEQVQLELPSGKTLEVPADSVFLPSEKTRGEVAVETALSEFLHTPYVFGARSPLGLDCSGLVGVSWAAAGVQLPRDAHQQALVGELVATHWFTDALEPGDVLFFLGENGRVFHAGLSMGGMRFIHASPPEVQINSLDPADPLYSEGWHKAFALARRPAR